jgi:hypothetical protein
MAKTAKKKVAKKASTTTKSTGDHVERREKVIHLLLRTKGVTLAELKDAGHHQAAAAALRLAETRGLKTKTDKVEGEVTRYYATGTPTPVGTKKAGAKKAVKKAAAKKKAPAKKKVAKKAPAKRKPAADKPAVAEATAAA